MKRSLTSRLPIIALVLVSSLALSACADPAPLRRNRYSSVPYTEPATPSDKGDLVHDVTNVVWDENDRLYKEMQIKASEGDEEAQRWMQKYGPLYKLISDWSRRENNR